MTTLAPHLEFVRTRLDCASALRGAMKLHGISDLDKAHAEALHSLSMLKLHKIVGQPDAADLLAVRDDLIQIAGIVDKLILAVGDEAASASNKVDLTLFEDQVIGAVDGNAAYSLTEAAEEIKEALAHEGVRVRVVA
jgi:hypothetical protein